MPADHDPLEESPSTDASGADASPLGQAWQRLAKADEIVQGFAERGWITPEAMAEVDRRTEQVARRVGREEQGLSLADEAIARQPSLAPETPVAVTLEDAQGRLSSTHAAYDDLG